MTEYLQPDKKWNKNPAILRFFGKEYFVKTPWWVKKLWPNYVWGIETKQKILYLSFDDGPHPIATPFVLDQLNKYNAKATFFCIGKNVVSHPALYKRIQQEGHSIGNHTHQHLNGWKTKDEIYLADIAEASQWIGSGLFRPPYGRIRSSQALQLGKAMKKESPKIIMWSVLSGDFDEKLSKEACLNHVISYAKPGSIIVFHDSEKAFSRLAYALPRLLENFTGKGYIFKRLDEREM